MRDLSVLLEREKELKVKFDSLMAFVQPYVTEFKDRASLEELKQYDSLESYLRNGMVQCADSMAVKLNLPWAFRVHLVDYRDKFERLHKKACVVLGEYLEDAG